MAAIRESRSGKAATPSNLSLEAMGVKPYEIVKGEEYMDGRMVDHFRHILQCYKKQLMENVDETVSAMKDDSANLPDPNDRATLEEEFNLELRTRDRERKLIKKIEKSQSSLEVGDYGYCDACGVEIGVRRLEARPTATLCVDCKTIEEIKEGKN
ncbi:MAG: RNA polymerase-binding protein DksA [Gammaproteobacteria bacterium]|nr:RNA polymerase-binding protein DksA [Gammaproteobacteria bacterium]